jgi:hypothetical protein
MKKYTTAEHRGLGEAFCSPMAVVLLCISIYDSGNGLYERRRGKRSGILRASPKGIYTKSADSAVGNTNILEKTNLIPFTPKIGCVRAAEQACAASPDWLSGKQTSTVQTPQNT